MKTTVIIRHYLTEDVLMVCDLVSSVLNKLPERGDVLHLPIGSYKVTLTRSHQHFRVDQRGLSVSGREVDIFVQACDENQAPDADA